MPVYLGTLGRMVKLPYVTAQQVETEERYSFQTTLEGRRKAQVKATGRRTWSLTTEHFRPNEVGLLQQFVEGAWGSGPFVFVSGDAPVTNMLSPATASCDPTLLTHPAIEPSGPMRLMGNDFAGRSYFNSDPTIGLVFPSSSTPAIPGSRVTASAYLRGSGARCYVSFWDSSGNFISSFGGPADGIASETRRLFVSATVPPDAVRCLVYGVNATQGAQPAITWSNKVLPWSAGEGCEKAVVHGLSRDLRLAVEGATYSNLSFAVSEVG